MHVDFLGHSAEDLMKRLDRDGIDKCWLLSWEEHDSTNPLYQHLSIANVAATFQAYPDRVIPFCAPDPKSPGAAARVRTLSSQGFRGCGELKASVRWDSPEVGELLSVLNELRMPLVFHMQEGHTVHKSTKQAEALFAKLYDSSRLHGLSGKSLRALEKLYWPLARMRKRMEVDFPGYMLDFASLELRVREFRDLPFVAHGPLVWQRPLTAADAGGDSGKEHLPGCGPLCHLLENYSNVYADLSGGCGYAALVRDPDISRRFLMRFSDRLLYGTDNCKLGLDRFIHSLNLGKKAEERIFGTNASGLLPAPVTQAPLVSL